MRVIFVNRYFFPDHSATSQMVSDLAFHLASRGWEVGMITSRQRYDDAGAQLAKRERVRGVAVRRVWSTTFGRHFLPGRAVDYATFYLSAMLAMMNERRATVVAMTDPPMMSVVSVGAAALGRAARPWAGAPTLVNWLQDLFPDVATALGMRVPGLVRRIRDWSLRKAKANVVIGESMRAPKAVVIHNWADPSLHPVDGLNPSRMFMLGYSGNLGRVHDVSTMLGAMNRLRGEEIELVITGGGAKLDDVRAASLPNVRIEPYAPRERLSESLSAADAHLVTLLPAVEGLVVPSKFYGILAVARPVLYVGARDGELARLIRENDCGIAVESGDADGLADAIRALASHREKARAMGLRGRALYERRFAPAIAFAAWEKVLGA
jgi:glycosyltransferase involved in cell wall biosynthesis